MSGTAESRAVWIARLSPTDPQALSMSLLPAALLDRLASEVGPEPVGWAVELGRGMARRITEQVPALATDGVVQEVRKGCESVALAVLVDLAVKEPAAFVTTEMLQGPAELVSRGIGMEEMLKSIQLAQAFAAKAVVAAVEEVVPPAERFTETVHVLDLILGVGQQATEAMIDEFARAQKAWWTSSSAARLELVREILAGQPVVPDRAVRTLGYDLTRQHTGLVLWADETRPDHGELRALAEHILRAQGCSATLVLPVGRRRAWAWGSGLTGPATGRSPDWPTPPPGIRVAVGLPGRAGADGFRRTHLEAVEAASVGMRSATERRLFRYEDVDVLVLLMQRPELARDFVRRELGALTDPGPGAATLRTTLKCYLDVERSLTEAAARLNVARNTVAYRVQRAKELRGLDISQRRMQLQAALALAEEFGDLVLRERRAPSGDEPGS